MATTAKTSEAQRIVDELIEQFGMAGAAIAREIGVKADTIQNIKGRRATGNLQVARLRILREQLASAAQPPNAAQNREPSAAPLSETFPPVADLFAPVQAGPEPATATLNGEEPTPEPKKPLRERATSFLRDAMLGKVTVDAAPLTKASKKASDGAVTPRDVAEQMTPVVSAMVILAADWLIRDPYKPCAPTDQEAYAMLYPIVKRLARKVEAQRQLTEDDMELLGMALAMAAYGRRVQRDAKMIHAEEVQRARSHNGPTANGAGSVAGFPAAAPADAGARSGGADAGVPLPLRRGAGHDRQAPGGAGRGPSRGGPGGDERQANALLDDLLKQDAAGRSRLGLQ